MLINYFSATVQLFMTPAVDQFRRNPATPRSKDESCRSADFSNFLALRIKAFVCSNLITHPPNLNQTHCAVTKPSSYVNTFNLEEVDRE